MAEASSGGEDPTASGSAMEDAPIKMVEVDENNLYTVETLASVFAFVGIRPKRAKKLAKIVFGNLASSPSSTTFTRASQR